MKRSKLSEYIAQEVSQKEEEFLASIEPALEAFADNLPADDMMELQVAVEEAQQIENHYNFVCEAHVALEKTNEILGNMLEEEGGISVESAQLMTLGLSPYSEFMEFGDKLQLSSESFEGSASRARTTEASMEAAKEVLKAAWDQLKAVLDVLMKAIADVIVRVLSATDKIADRCERLSKLASKATGAAEKSEIKASSTLLFVDGDYEGDKPQAVAGMAKVLFDKVPSTITKTADDILKGILDSTLKNTSEVADVISEEYKDDPFSDFTKLKFLGNMALETYTMGNVMGLRLASDKNMKAAPKDFMIKVGTSADLTNRLRSIAAVAREVSTLSKKSRDEAKRLSNKMLDEAKKLSERDKVGDADAGIKMAIANIGNLVVGMKAPLVGGSSHTTKVLYAYMRQAERELALYRKDTTEKLEDKSGN